MSQQNCLCASLCWCLNTYISAHIHLYNVNSTAFIRLTINWKWSKWNAMQCCRWKMRCSSLFTVPTVVYIFSHTHTSRPISKYTKTANKQMPASKEWRKKPIPTQKRVHATLTCTYAVPKKWVRITLKMWSIHSRSYALTSHWRINSQIPVSILFFQFKQIRAAQLK